MSITSSVKMALAKAEKRQIDLAALYGWSKQSMSTKFARDINLKAHEGGWFGANDYACEFPTPPYAAFLPTLRDDSLPFMEEEPLPPGYRPGDIVL